MEEGAQTGLETDGQKNTGGPWQSGETVGRAAHADEPGAVEEDALTPLDPRYKSVLRIGACITAIPFLIGAVVAEGALAEVSPLPFGALIGVVVFLFLILIVRIPHRRWQARGYQMGADRLRVVRGILWHSDTIVPFGRVQHIDLDQGPIERAYGIATISVHTAGSHNATVELPGLAHDDAVAMREEIRAHIKRETI